jgi:hypothetical protein
MWVLFAIDYPSIVVAMRFVPYDVAPEYEGVAVAIMIFSLAFFGTLQWMFIFAIPVVIRHWWAGRGRDK